MLNLNLVLNWSW